MAILEPNPRATRPLQVRSYPTQPLPPPEATSTYPLRRNWPERHLNSTGVLVLGCITEGEADYRVHSAPDSPPQEWVVTLPQGTFFLVPPHTLFSDGGKVAWERPHPERAYARGLLIHLRRDGVSCHTYTCQDDQLWLHPYVFVFVPETAAISEKVLAEMAIQEQVGEPVTRLYLELLLRLILRKIASGEFASMHRQHTGLAHTEDPHPTQILAYDALVPVATALIRQSLGDDHLRAAWVAKRTGYSQRHLNRMFIRTLGMTVPAFIKEQRLQHARELLAHNSLPVQVIGIYCGFRSQATFSTWFARNQGCSPLAYRRENKHSPQVQLRMSQKEN